MIHEDGAPYLTTAELIQRWGITKQGIYWRAMRHPEILTAKRISPNLTVWPLAAVEEYERTVIGQ